MENNNSNSQISSDQAPASIHFGHLGLIMFAALVLLGITWMKNPALFSFKKNQSAVLTDANVPRYYPYTPPPEDQQPQVLGASTEPQGPSIIQDDGTVVPVDMSQVLGASTQGVQLSLDGVKVNAVAESAEAVKKYFSQAQAIEAGSVGDANFAGALSSGNQDQINQQAQKVIAVRDALQKISVPQGLVKLQKLKIIQYNSAIALLQNFTLADNNPEQTNLDLQQFIKSLQDQDSENIAVAQKYGALDPYSNLYSNTPGSVTVAANQATLGSDYSSTITNNSGLGNVGP